MFDFLKSISSNNKLGEGGSGSANLTNHDATGLLSEVGLGAMTGLVTGYLLKKLSQAIALLLLAGYAGLQAAKMRGLVADSQIETLTTSAQELGQKGRAGLEPLLRNQSQYLTEIGLSSVLSFGTGFYIGFFYG